MQETTRTSEGLRSTLFDTLDRFLRGEIDHVAAKTTAKIADSIIKSVSVDLEHKRLSLMLERSETPPALSMRLNIPMTKETFEESPVSDVEIVDANDVRGKDPASQPTKKKAASRLKKVLIVGLLPHQAGIVQQEFCETFDISYCTADDTNIIESKAPTHDVLMMVGFISHKASALVESLTSEFSMVKGGVGALKKELKKMHDEMPR